jgi:hypothetical protein
VSKENILSILFYDDFDTSSIPEPNPAWGVIGGTWGISGTNYCETDDTSTSIDNKLAVLSGGTITNNRILVTCLVTPNTFVISDTSSSDRTIPRIGIIARGNELVYRYPTSFEQFNLNIGDLPYVFLNGYPLEGVNITLGSSYWFQIYVDDSTQTLKARVTPAEGDFINVPPWVDCWDIELHSSVGVGNIGLTTGGNRIFVGDVPYDFHATACFTKFAVETIPNPNPLVVDDSDPGFSITQQGVADYEAWSFHKSCDAYRCGYFAGKHDNYANMETASWSWTVPESGRYSLYTTWPYKAFGIGIPETLISDGTNSFAQYTIINNSSTLANINVDQTRVPDDDVYDNWRWKRLGFFDLSPGNLTLQLSSSPVSYLPALADAARIEYWCDCDSPPYFFDDFAATGINSCAWQYTNLYSYDVGNWHWNSGVFTQDSLAGYPPPYSKEKKALLVKPEFLNDYEIRAKMQVTAWSGVPFARAGVSLGCNTYNYKGYNLVFFENFNTVAFFDDVDGVDATFSYTWSTGNWYWFRFRRQSNNNYGKIWQEGDSEPLNWQYTHTRTQVPGVPGLNSGPLGIATSFDDVEVTTGLDDECVPLFVSGFVPPSASGTIPLFVRANLYGEQSSQTILYIDGYDTATSVFAPLFISGPQSINNTTPLFIHGPEVKAQALNLTLFSPVYNLSGTAPLFIRGSSQPESVAMSPLYIAGEFHGQSINLFISGTGILPAKDSITLFINAINPYAETITPLYLHHDIGATGIVPLTISGGINTYAGDITLYIERDFEGIAGYVPLGLPNVSPYIAFSSGDPIPLVMPLIVEPTPYNDDFPLVIPATYAAITGKKPLYISGF